jgi:hypothetical protein
MISFQPEHFPQPVTQEWQMKALIAEIKQRKINMDSTARLEHAEQLVALLTHAYIHLGMGEAHAYRSALADFESDYPQEISQLRSSVA